MIHNIVSHFANQVGWGPTILALLLLLVALCFGLVEWLQFEIRLAGRVLRRSL